MTLVLDLKRYRARPSEQDRTTDLLNLIPKARQSVLDIGAREGHFSRLLADHFAEVTALDLEKPRLDIPRVTAMAGDVTHLPFGNNSFDCVFCVEVLEHIPDVQQACREILRVARHEIVIGVPFEQDIRFERNTCQACGKISPPWGHIQSFNEKRLRDLFPGTRVLLKSGVGLTRDTTNALSTFLMDLGGNPWGTSIQEEPCPHCGAKLVAPENRSLGQKACAALANRLNRIQARWTPWRANWIHIVFSKTSA